MIESILKGFEVWTDAQGVKSKGRSKSIDNISLEGIARLRELIFDIAVQGKLVDQNIKEEPATILLDTLEKEKEKLTKDSKFKSSQFNSIEPFQIPGSWQWTYLENIALDIHYGFNAASNPANKGIKLLRITDIQNDDVNWETVPGCEISKDQIPNYLLENGDILIARTGGTIGKSYLVSNLNLEAVFASYLIRVKKLPSSYSDFIKIYLGSKLYWKQLYESSMGTGQPNVNGTSLKKLMIPFPPLAEQKRIVAKVDELMFLCDQLEEQQTANLTTHHYLVKILLETLTNAADANELQIAWEKLSEHFDTLFCTEDSIEQLKQTILQLAIMGRLVKQDSNDEPASQLIERIIEEKGILIEEGKLKKQNILADIKDEEKPYSIPESWSWVRLGNITSKIGSGSTPRGGNNVYADSGILFLRSQNIRNEGLLLDDVVYIDEETNKKMSNTIVLPNDILLNITGGSLGRCTIFPAEEKIANVSQHVTIIRPSVPDSTLYLHSCILSPYIQDLIWGRQIGANREGLSKRILEQFEIPFPPLEEQKRIVAKVQELLSICDSLSMRITKSRGKQNMLSVTIVESVIA
ncbi:restriction endonuclease subunit S [Chitinophaga niabensis]|uniref:Type I restriction enzyme, S subunit n=1 Tax=Chitinophaga niabensis TaxID=536979 RepID=A0A1N6FBP4_9BACT|nr:restriction endonuclease subunit S [Chitinophaga niabensis]SIN92667.1 type I restriction enzyme, S subunit [Chitinophaga niabensis]